MLVNRKKLQNREVWGKAIRSGMENIEQKRDDDTTRRHFIRNNPGNPEHSCEECGRIRRRRALVSPIFTLNLRDKFARSTALSK